MLFRIKGLLCSECLYVRPIFFVKYWFFLFHLKLLYIESKLEVAFKNTGLKPFLILNDFSLSLIKKIARRMIINHFQHGYTCLSFLPNQDHIFYVYLAWLALIAASELSLPTMRSPFNIKLSRNLKSAIHHQDTKFKGNRTLKMSSSNYFLGPSNFPPLFPFRISNYFSICV